MAFLAGRGGFGLLVAFSVGFSIDVGRERVFAAGRAVGGVAALFARASTSSRASVLTSLAPPPMEFVAGFRASWNGSSRNDLSLSPGNRFATVVVVICCVPEVTATQSGSKAVLAPVDAVPSFARRRGAGARELSEETPVTL